MRTKLLARSIVVILSGLIGASFAGRLAAQAPATTQGPVAPVAELQTVMVTAQKVKQDIRQVPTSVSVVSAADITDQHMAQMSDLTRSVPNLSFSSQGGEGNQNIELRGVSSNAGSSTVAVYLDDVPLTVRNLDTQGQVEPNFFDVARVEVLRGPQGTLYGASSEGGTIRFISNPVDLHSFSGDVYADVSGTKHGGTNHSERAVLNAPLIPGSLGLRAGVSVTTDSGYIDHYNPDDFSQQLARGVNGDRMVAARAQLLWQVGDALSVRPAVLYQRTKSDDLNVVDLGSADFLSQHKRVAEPGDDEMVVPSLTVDYHFPAADLTAVSSYFYRDFDRWVDGTAYNSGFIGSLIDGAGITGLDGNLDGYLVGNVASPVHYRIWTQQFSEEVRLASTPNDKARFSWIVGAFYSDQKVDSRDFETAPGINNTLTSAYGSGILTSLAFLNALGTSTVPVFPNDYIYLQNKLYQERQIAGFGELTWHATPSTRATAGLRLLDARTSFLRIGEYYFATGSPPGVSVVDHGRPVTPKFSLSHDFDQSTTGYVTASKGFRLGGPNRPLASFCPPAPESYSADSLWNYEAGVKSRMLDNTLYFAGDVFYIDWKHIQVDINLPCGFDYFTNAGNARSYGSELQLDYKPVAGLTLSFDVGYTHATLTDDVPALGITAGEAVPGAPRWSAGVSGRYSVPLERDLQGNLTWNWNYVGSSHGAVIITDPDYNRTAYAVFGMTAGVTWHNWQFLMFGRNLFNDQKVIQRPNLQSVNRGYMLTPRTLGVSVEYAF
ncbi:MAG: TonB-dependent receptor [Proteobacteria bacterium]|nr:TonB-dependent receptor [Pseudomonadota bacterium]